MPLAYTNCMSLQHTLSYPDRPTLSTQTLTAHTSNLRYLRRSACAFFVAHMAMVQTVRGTVESQHARGLTIQLSQGQGRQPLRPEGAPPAAGVLHSHADLAFDGGEWAAG
jgi:hypothetical protein